MKLKVGENEEIIIEKLTQVFLENEEELKYYLKVILDKILLDKQKNIFYSVIYYFEICQKIDNLEYRSKFRYLDLYGDQNIKDITKMIDYLISKKGKENVLEKVNPYKFNKLTYLLHEMLFDNYKTFFIANCFCDINHYTNTIETLKFSQKVNQLEKVKFNNKYSDHLQKYFETKNKICEVSKKDLTVQNINKTNNKLIDSNLNKYDEDNYLLDNNRGKSNNKIIDDEDNFIGCNNRAKTINKIFDDEENNEEDDNKGKTNKILITSDKKINNSENELKRNIISTDQINTLAETSQDKQEKLESEINNNNFLERKLEENCKIKEKNKEETNSKELIKKIISLYKQNKILKEENANFIKDNKNNFLDKSKLSIKNFISSVDKIEKLFSKNKVCLEDLSKNENIYLNNLIKAKSNESVNGAQIPNRKPGCDFLSFVKI